MEPVTLVVAALVAGATAVGKAAVNEGVKDAYGALKEAVGRRVGRAEQVESACHDIQHAAATSAPAEAESVRALEEAIQESRADADPELLARVADLEDELRRAGRTHATTAIDARWSRGAVIGDGNTVHQRFDAAD